MRGHKYIKSRRKSKERTLFALYIIRRETEQHFT